MEKYEIQVENIKCGGCMNSIKRAISSIAGVQMVEVIKETESVIVEGASGLRQSITEKLASLGYPEKGNNNLVHKAKSFVSCAIGRLTTE